MSVVRRPLLTAVAAGALLCALWFVPSANATDDRSAPAQVSERTVHSLSSGESDEDSAAADVDPGRNQQPPGLPVAGQRLEHRLPQRLARVL
ncbi:hypothetical protein ACWCOZ_12140, partial [Streptomyces sp. NPDC001840]